MDDKDRVDLGDVFGWVVVAIVGLYLAIRAFLD